MHRYWVFVLLGVLVVVGCSGSTAADTESASVPAQAVETLPPTAIATRTHAAATLAPKPATPTLRPATSTPESPTVTPESLKAMLEPVLPAGVIAGLVRDAEGAVAGANVRVRLTEHESTTAADGSFSLSGLKMMEPISVTAWAEGYYVGVADGTPGLVPITITLKPHYTTDNLDYEWFEFQGVEGSASCAPCHTANAEWERDAHSQSAVNPRFLTMYEGTDVHGNKSPSSYDASGRIQSPDLSQPYYGPGYRIDYRDRSGNCAACHTPLADNLEPSNTCGWSGCHSEFTASMSDVVPQGIYPTDLEGDAADGVACDFCHKIGEVYVDPDTALPYANKPGISSMRLYRPPEGEQLFFGTYDDVTRRVTYLPLEEESAFCAPCHYGVFGGVVGHNEVVGGVVVYNSYGEWLESPYSDPETGQTCQDCHMLPVENDYFVFLEQGGLRRAYKPVHNHYMPGAADEALLQNSVTMTTAARLEGEEVWVEVGVTNDKTGHHVPTGTPLRHMILVVEVVDAGGKRLPLRDGPVLPDWTGDYAGEAGRYYAKVLKDEWTGESPTGAYWRDISLVEDTRLAAFATDVSQYTYAAPVDGPVTIEVRLLFRRAFQQLMEWKGWDDPDILMEEATIVLPSGR
jgi:hypothetical protein